MSWLDVYAPFTLSDADTVNWTLSYNVWGSVVEPQNNISDHNRNAETWSEFILDLPDELKNRDDFEVDDSWYFCGRYIWATQMTFQDEDGVDESCEGVVPDECLSVLRDAAESGDVCSFEGPFPDACSGYLTDIPGDEESVMWSFETRLNETGPRQRLSLEDDGRLGVGSLSFVRSRAGNFTEYDERMREYYIALFGFAQSPEDDDDDAGPGQPGNIRCLYASPVSGSRSFEEGSGADGHLFPSLTVLLGITTLLVAGLAL
ncbi:hypothetical protein S40293_11515 [Stachybotrys chartarum IBT 40293]|nr:hypothetical protein S40293_11515 [Stachybotrys chartarum IBT 40293]